MESSRYLCAIKVLYTGRATFEIKGGDRTSVPGEAKTVNSLRPSSSLLLFSLFRIVPRHSASFIYERSDRFTYNDRWQETTRNKVWGKRHDEGEQTRDFIGIKLAAWFFMSVVTNGMSFYTLINIYISIYLFFCIFFRILATVTSEKHKYIKSKYKR